MGQRSGQFQGESTAIIPTNPLLAGREGVVKAVPHFVKESDDMAEGTIKRLTDKGFGFIDTGTGKDLFFHSSALEGVTYQELQEGQRVSFTEGSGPKGPRAENVRLA